MRIIRIMQCQIGQLENGNRESTFQANLLHIKFAHSSTVLASSEKKKEKKRCKNFIHLLDHISGHTSVSHTSRTLCSNAISSTRLNVCSQCLEHARAEVIFSRELWLSRPMSKCEKQWLTVLGVKKRSTQVSSQKQPRAQTSQANPNAVFLLRMQPVLLKSSTAMSCVAHFFFLNSYSVPDYPMKFHCFQCVGWVRLCQ